jgi:hypothetical protein
VKVAIMTANVEFEDYNSGAESIRKRLAAQLAGHPSTVTLTVTAHDESSPPRVPEQVIVFRDQTRSSKTTGNPLLITVHCDNPEVWDRMDAVFTSRDRFEKFGPRSAHGSQCYKSLERALIVVPEHPAAVMAVERTGIGRLAWIAPA